MKVYFTKRSSSVKKIFLFSLLFSSLLFAAPPKKIVIIGGASDIGQALTKELLRKGHTVVAADDDQDILNDMQEQYGISLIIRDLPITQAEKSRITFKKIIEEIGGLDICILCCAVAPEIKQYGLLHDGDIPWGPSKETIEVNVMGVTALANVAMNHFIDHEKGYLVGISSLDSLVGHPGCPCYTASKAFMSNYLGAMHKKCARLKLHDIVLCDIRWSFVHQVEQEISIGWTEDPDKAAIEMLKAIEQKKRVSYIMDRWNFAIWALMAIPSLIQNVISGISVIKMAHK